MVLIFGTDQYLAVHINRVNHVVTPDDRGSVNCYIVVAWAGMMKKTKTVYRSNAPVFDETFYFPIVIN